jgi:peroxiredoxin
MDSHMTKVFSRPLQPGDAAPDFVLQAVQTDRTVSLSDYRNRSALFLALFRGLYCPFCRRAIAHMAASAEKLKPFGIQSLGIVATELENARLYYRFRPMRLELAVDPALSTHRSYGVPKPDPTPEFFQAFESLRFDASGELPVPLPVEQASAALDHIDGFRPTPTDQRDAEQHYTQLDGQFLIDRSGIIRWANIECAREGPAGLGKFPVYEELLIAAQVAVTA